MSRGLIARLLRRPAEHGEPVPDAVLLDRYARTRDEAAFELLVWRHAALVLGVCRRAVLDHHRAEDAFQAVFLVLARKAGSVRGANLPGWLFRVARRVAARAAAGERRRREEPLAVEPATEPPCPAENREELAVLDEEVARLPDRFRRPVLLCYLGGHTTEDAARVLGCPRGTVLSRLATARAKLADRLSRRGVTLPAGVVGVSAVNAVVPPTVRAVSAYLGRAAGPVPSSFLLADGVLRAMTLGKLLTATGGLVVAAGLLGGYAVWPGGDAGGPVALAADEPKKEKEPPKTPDAERTQQLGAVRKRIDDLERQVARAEEEIDLRREDLQRLLVREEELLAEARTSRPNRRQELLEAIQAANGEFGQLLRMVELDERRKGGAKAADMKEALAKGQTKIDTAKKALADFDERVVPDLIDRRQKIARLEQSIQRLDQSSERQLATLRKTLDALQHREFELTVGVPLLRTGNVDTAETKLNQILRELRELRKEVVELRQKK